VLTGPWVKVAAPSTALHEALVATARIAQGISNVATTACRRIGWQLRDGCGMG
jgi:hypothetical protein